MAVRITVDLDGTDPPEGVVCLETDDDGVAGDGLSFSGWLGLMLAMQALVERARESP